MNKNIHTFILVFLLIAGFVIRSISLSNLPSGLHRDEGFLGYNAYSLSKTGKDMTGSFLPLHLESFLYTPAGYSYMSIPFIILFGLNIFSIRLASAIFGTITILVVYFLAKELLKRAAFFKGKENSSIPLLSALFLTISPWHVNLSRTASVITVVVFFILLAVTMYFYSLKKKSLILVVLSFAFFFMSLFFYIAPYSFLPFFIPFLIFLFPHPKKKTNTISFALYCLLILIPLLITITSPKLSLRVRSLSILNAEEGRLVTEQFIREDGVIQLPPFITRLFHNKLYAFTETFTRNYFSHLSFDFLFIDRGFPDRYRIPGMGILYFFELPLLFFGLYFIGRTNKKIAVFLIGWIILSPIGSALTHDDVPNLQRTLILYPPLAILAAFGLHQLTILTSKPIFKKTVVLGFALFVLFNIIRYAHFYFMHGSVYRPWYRQDGYQELVSQVNTLLPSYKKAIITNRESAPTIFFLFFSRYNPSDFQKETKQSLLRDFDRVSFGKYEFSQEECPLPVLLKEKQKTPQKNILYVNSSLCQIPEFAKVIKTIKRSDGSNAFYVLVVQ